MSDEYESVPRIARLERWRREALAVLDEWEQVWIAAGRPGNLGETKAAGVLRVIEELRRETE